MEAFIDNVIIGTISDSWIKAVAASGLSERVIFVVSLWERGHSFTMPVVLSWKGEFDHTRSKV